VTGGEESDQLLEIRRKTELLVLLNNHKQGGLRMNFQNELPFTIKGNKQIKFDARQDEKGGEGFMKGKSILIAPGLPASTQPEEIKSVPKLNDSSVYSRIGQQAPIKQKSSPALGGGRGRGGPVPPPISRNSGGGGPPARPRYKALYDYEAQNPDELSMNIGDIIDLIDKEDEAWFKGELNGQVGIFPAQYCEEVKSAAPPRPAAPRGGASPARGGATRGGSTPSPPGSPTGRGSAPSPPGRGGFPARGGAPTRGGRGY